MKIILSLLLLITCAFDSIGQLCAVGYKSEKFLQFKASKTLAVKTGNSDFDEALENAMKSSWKSTPFELISSEDFDKRLPDPSVSFIVSIIIPGQHANQNHHYIALLNGGKKKISKYAYSDMIAYSPRNFFVDEKKTSDCAFRIRNIIESLQQGIEIVEKNNLEEASITGSLEIVNDLRDYYCKKSSKIKDRTLLICTESIGKKLKESDMSKVYPYKFEFCSKEKLTQVIKDRSKDYYYFQPGITINKSMFVFDPSNGEVVYFAYQIMGMNINSNNIEDLTNTIKSNKK